MKFYEKLEPIVINCSIRVKYFIVNEIVITYVNCHRYDQEWRIKLYKNNLN